MLDYSFIDIILNSDGLFQMAGSFWLKSKPKYINIQCLFSFALEESIIPAI